MLISFKKLFEPIPDDQLFDDELFWNMAYHDDVGWPEKNLGRRKSRSRSIAIQRPDPNMLAVVQMKQQEGQAQHNAGYLP